MMVIWGRSHSQPPQARHRVATGYASPATVGPPYQRIAPAPRMERRREPGPSQQPPMQREEVADRDGLGTLIDVEAKEITLAASQKKIRGASRRHRHQGVVMRIGRGGHNGRICHPDRKVPDFVDKPASKSRGQALSYPGISCDTPQLVDLVGGGQQVAATFTPEHNKMLR